MKQFQEAFDNAPTIDAKRQILQNLMDSNPLDPATLEVIIDYKQILQDLIDEEVREQDKQITQDIEAGKYTLMTCLEDVYPFEKGNHYYVRVDDMATELKEVWKDNMTLVLEDYINSIKPITWIVSDCGLGTPKFKMTFDKPLSQYFR